LAYTLLHLADKAESTAPRDAIWRSRLHYRLSRFFRERIKSNGGAPASRDQLLADALREIGGALNAHKGAYRLPLSVLLYRRRQ
jgi:CRISPR-associated protein Csm1